jgi:predicted dithiol-disulfide oxidoreductase (DUF899 family)
MKSSTSTQPRIVSPEEWLAARREFLREEKQFSKLRDQLAAHRRALPWVKVDRTYTFESAEGAVTLAELFEGRSQLLSYHFMFGPGWDEGCRGCSFVSDHFDGAIPHLNAKDVSFAAVSRAPLAEFLPFKQRMGWHFNWVSSNQNSFNFDYHVSFTPKEVAAGKGEYNFVEREIPMEELPGLSAFARGENGEIYHTYSTYSRGLDVLIGAYNLLDLSPKGRNENSEHKMDWVRLHDQYDRDSVAS